MFQRLAARAVRRQPLVAAQFVYRPQLGLAGLSARAMSPASRPFASSADTVKLTFIDFDGEEVPIKAKVGDNLLELAQANDIELEGACDMTLACSTCHVILEPEVYNRLPPPEDEELDLLDMAVGLTDTSRLGCQVKVTKDLEGATISLPEEFRNLQG